MSSGALEYHSLSLGARLVSTSGVAALLVLARSDLRSMAFFLATILLCAVALLLFPQGVVVLFVGSRVLIAGLFCRCHDDFL